MESFMSLEMPAELAALIVDPAGYANSQQIYSAFAEIRRDYPLAKAKVEDFDPFWVASRHVDVKTIETRPDVFLNGAGVWIGVQKGPVSGAIGAQKGP